MALEAQDITCGYDLDCVVRGVSFSLEPGRVACVLGPNGVGKTTLFKALLGFLPLDAGSVTVDGRQLQTMLRAEVARAIAYVPQQVKIPFSYSVEQFVLMGRSPHLRLLQQPGPHDRDVARQMLGRMGIEQLAGRQCTEISGGELQLACIARALTQEPCYLIMDEPTASLDFGNSARVLAQALDLARDGIGVLMTTHDPGQAFALNAQVVLLGRGGSSHVGLCHDVLTQDTLRATYGVDVVVQSVEHAGRQVISCTAVVDA